MKPCKWELPHEWRWQPTGRIQFMDGPNFEPGDGPPYQPGVDTCARCGTTRTHDKPLRVAERSVDAEGWIPTLKRCVPLERAEEGGK